MSARRLARYGWAFLAGYAVAFAAGSALRGASLADVAARLWPW